MPPSERPTTRAELVESLVVERYACNDWWTTPAHYDPQMPMQDEIDERHDNEFTWAQRRRDLDREMGATA